MAGPAALVALVVVLVVCVLIGLAVAAVRQSAKFVGGSGEFPFRARCLPPAETMFARLADAPKVITVSGSPVMVRRFPEDYMLTDGLSDHFTEDVRVDCRFGDQPTPREAHAAGAGRGEDDPCVARELVYAAAPGCNSFNPAFAKWVVEETAGRGAKVLDPSSGWGDRLIGAIAAGAQLYQGYDPNPRLASAYERIAAELGGSASCRVTTSAFEEADVPAAEFDLAFTSPPYYSLEKYVEPGAPGASDQSVVRWPKFEDWVREMYVPYIRKMHRAVKPGGWIVLYVEDVTVDGVRRPLRQIAAREMRRLGVAKARGRPSRFGLRVDYKGKPGKVRWALAWKKAKRVRFASTRR